MARPRTVTDDEALAAARACITEHGPAVSLSRIARAVGLTAPALIKRFGSKEELVFRALLPKGPPSWQTTLREPPGDDIVGALARVLVDLCQEFQQVGPALAALRMSGLGTDRIFPPDRPGPPVVVRRLLADWLDRAGVSEPAMRAEMLAGAAEARGLLSWVGPQMVDEPDVQRWAAELAASATR